MYDKNTRKLLNGAAWLGFSAILLKIIGLVYKIPMSYLLGDEGMGYFNSAYTVYVFFYIIGSAGIPKAVSILCSRSSEGEAKTIFTLIYRIYFLIGSILSVMLLLFADFISESIGSDNSKYAIFAIAPSILFVCSAGVLRGYLSGKTKFVPIAISELISALFKLCLGILLALYAIKRAYPLPIVCAFSILGITLGTFFSFLYLYISYRKESKNIKNVHIKSNEILKEVFCIGLPITFAAIVSGLVSIIDLMLMMNRLRASGYSETVCVAIYGNYTTLAVPMFSFVTNLINTISIAALPIIVSSVSRRKYNEAEVAISSSLKILSFISIPAFFAFFILPTEILGAVFEEGSARLGSGFLFLLAPGIIFYFLLTLCNTALEGAGKIKAAVATLIVGAAVKCILSFFMIGSDGVGALGAPISTSASYLVSFIVSYCFYKKYIGEKLGIKLSISENIRWPSFASLASVIIVILIKKSVQNVLSFRISSMLFLCIYGVLYLFFITLFTIMSGKKKDLIVIFNKKTTC